MAKTSWQRLLILLATLLFLATFVSPIHAHDVDDDDVEPIVEKIEETAEKAAEAVKSAVKRAIVHFKPSSISGEFVEQFGKDWKNTWIVSEAKKSQDGVDDDELLRYRGEWNVEEATVLKGIEGDLGLVAKTPAAHHAISAKFPHAIDNKGKQLVIQYEVKLQDGLECGGAYIKLLKDQKSFDPKKFEDKYPYVIMFGPDRCGATNKVHFIFKHKNPKSGEYEEKHLNAPPTAHVDKKTNLYTLVINPDNTFEILINNKVEKKGSLLEDFTPAVNPAKEIDDPEDKKPNDWVDTPKIPDPEAKKPDDWDEDAPEYIPDEDATKPENWLDDEPEMIPDPEATKPDDWDDDEDGDWVPPMVANPKCEGGNCGVWKRPTKKNPDYKGKWKAPMIDNPDYKGPWAPRKIANPNYFEDKHPSNMEPIGAVGIEIWTLQKDIMFDNVYIGHDAKKAKEFAEETWKVKYDQETALEEADKPKEEKKADEPKKESTKDTIVDKAKQEADKFVKAAQKDPVEAVQKHPWHFATLLGTVLLGLALLAALFGESEPPKKVVKEKKEASVADIADKVAKDSVKEKETVVKRTKKSEKSDDE